MAVIFNTTTKSANDKEAASGSPPGDTWPMESMLTVRQAFDSTRRATPSVSAGAERYDIAAVSLPSGAHTSIGGQRPFAREVFSSTAARTSALNAAAVSREVDN